MANMVLKGDGSKVPFDASKLKASIEGAAMDAGLAKEAAAPAIDKAFSAALNAAENKAEISTAELKSVVLDELDKENPDISAAWRKYDAERGK